MIEGVVVNISSIKTAMVCVTSVTKHPLYKKEIRKEKKFACQYDGIELNKGDKVLIKSCRPFSKSKKHIVVKKISI